MRVPLPQAIVIGSRMSTLPILGQSEPTPQFLLELFRERYSLSSEVGKPIESSLELLVTNPPGEETNSGKQN